MAVLFGGLTCRPYGTLISLRLIILTTSDPYGILIYISLKPGFLTVSDLFGILKEICCCAPRPVGTKCC